MNIFIEGARGVGKSTLVRGLRNNRMERILINHTGLNTDAVETKQKMSLYYNELLNWLSNIKDTGFTMLHDRFFLSETVMSKTYKTTYDFDDETEKLLHKMNDELGKSLVILITNRNKNELARNFTGDERLTKANLFERPDILDNAETAIQQQDEYLKVFNEMQDMDLDNITFIEFSTEGKSIEKCLEELEQIVENFKNG